MHPLICHPGIFSSNSLTPFKFEGNIKKLETTEVRSFQQEKNPTNMFTTVGVLA